MTTATALSKPSTSAPARGLHATFLATPLFPGLDVLRAFSILAVVWHHTAASTFDATLAHAGHHGVTLFFAISGFLIVTLLLREQDGHGRIDMRGFFVKRALRILPLYYLTLLAYCVLVYVFETDPAYRARFFDSLWYFATFTSNWIHETGQGRLIFYFAWSLAAEQQFYLVWPWIERYATRAAALTIAVAGVLLSPDFTQIVFGLHASLPSPFIVVSRFEAAIGLGVILAHALHHPDLYRSVAQLLGRRGSGFVTAALLIAALAAGARLGPAEAAIVDILAVSLVATFVIREDHDFAGLSRMPVLLWIGSISYGVYLLHMISANLFGRLLATGDVTSKPLIFAGSLIVTAALASFSHRTIERWFLDLKPRLLRARPAGQSADMKAS